MNNMKTTAVSSFVKALFVSSVMALSAAGCQKATSLESELIAFRMLDGEQTKATAVTSLDATGFRASAVTGTPGSETAAWTNVPFSKSGDYFVGGKYWPEDADPGYTFYAANAPLSYTSSGATVAATNTTDIVCAYKTSNAWKARPTLYFKHIFARISTVTVAPMSGYDVSDITLWIVNAKTGGTYNLRTGSGQTDGTGWSGLTPAGNADTQLFRYAGEITDGNSETGSDNDLYVVPGEYYLKGTWISGGNTYSGVLSNSTLSIVGGKVNTLACMMEGSAGIILSTLDGITWSYSTTFGVGVDTDPLAWPSPTDFGVNSSDNITWGDGVDLSLVNPLTGESMSRETANCYIVTEPGDYYLPLYYGNAIVGGSDNISTAAPAKGDNEFKGVFVNAYDVAISNGNIKTDLESTSRVLNTSGGKLIWSTASATSNALVIVDPNIYVKNGVGYLCFSVPTERFTQGSALIGVLKSGSTTEFVWAWHIWITNGNVLETEEYTNYQSNRIDFLNRSLGGRGGTSLICTYYQYGMPFPLPPSDGFDTTATLYDENGAYTFNYDSSNTITTLGKALSKPYLPRFNTNDFYNTSSGKSQIFCNMWDATQTVVLSDKAVVKTIYDPSPAGMSVPRRNAFTGFTTTGGNVTSGAPTNCNVVDSFSQGWKFKKNSSDATGSLWAASGYRYSGSAPAYVGSNGSYWSACLYEYGTSSGYYLNLSSSSVRPQSSVSRRWGSPVRPSLIEN